MKNRNSRVIRQRQNESSWKEGIANQQCLENIKLLQFYLGTTQGVKITIRLQLLLALHVIKKHTPLHTTLVLWQEWPTPPDVLSWLHRKPFQHRSYQMIRKSQAKGEDNKTLKLLRELREMCKEAHHKQSNSEPLIFVHWIQMDNKNLLK